MAHEQDAVIELLEPPETHVGATAAETGDLGGLALLPLFLSCRAAVRAKTSATAARIQGNADRARELENAAREYLAMAIDLLQPEPPRLIAAACPARASRRWRLHSRRTSALHPGH